MDKTESIKYGYHYRRAYKKGKFSITKNLVAYAYRNGLGYNRLGVTVKKNTGKSVERNRIKRLVKENFRYFGNMLEKGYDLVIVARKSSKDISYWDIRESMGYSLEKLGVLKREIPN